MLLTAAQSPQTLLIFFKIFHLWKHILWLLLMVLFFFFQLVLLQLFIGRISLPDLELAM